MCIPQILQTNEFVCVPLNGSHLRLDYSAVMESRNYLNIWRQSSWPTPEFTLDENLQDLLDHEKEHTERLAFTFTILSVDLKVCLGCVYIHPFVGDVLTTPSWVNNQQYCAMIRFWVRNSHQNTDLERFISNSIVSWIKQDWAFDVSIFATSEKCVQQQDLWLSIGLQEDGRIELKGKYAGTWISFR